MAHLPLSVADLPTLLLVAAIVFVGVAIALVDPLLVAMFAMPGVLIVHRVGAAGFNLSGSDVLTLAGVTVALPMLHGDMRSTRRLLGIAATYQAILLLVVVVHPNSRGVFEWWHRLVLVGGSIVVGAALGRARRASVAVSVFLVLTTGVAIAAIGFTLSRGLAPAEPFGFQKNFVGAMAASAVLLALLRPKWLALTDVQLLSIALICAGGLLASQSRGSMVALPAALFVAALRQGRLSRRSIIAILVAAPLLVFAVVSLQNESKQRHINSLTYRADYSALAYREWHLSPTFGQGLRFFEQPGALLNSDAHNVIATSLAEGGIVGLAGLALLVGLALVALWRLPPDVGALALAFVAGRFVHGLFDIYWVAATTTLPWIIVGIVCGTADADAADQVPAPAAQRLRVPSLARR